MDMDLSRGNLGLGRVGGTCGGWDVSGSVAKLRVLSSKSAAGRQLGSLLAVRLCDGRASGSWVATGGFGVSSMGERSESDEWGRGELAGLRVKVASAAALCALASSGVSGGNWV
jgi:hypothetical protein